MTNMIIGKQFLLTTQQENNIAANAQVGIRKTDVSIGSRTDSILSTSRWRGLGKILRVSKAASMAEEGTSRLSKLVSIVGHSAVIQGGKL